MWGTQGDVFWIKMMDFESWLHKWAFYTFHGDFQIFDNSFLFEVNDFRFNMFYIFYITNKQKSPSSADFFAEFFDFFLRKKWLEKEKFRPPPW